MTNNNTKTKEEITAKALEIALAAKKNGGCAYYVGGYVRDSLLAVDDGNDIDIELHGISAENAEKMLSSLGTVMKIGQSFGIFGLAGYPIDIALPRSERAVGSGHTDFEITVNPFIGTEKASRRRDFTINAIMRDVLTGEIIDNHGGLADLKNKILRHVDDISFSEDPLRVLRCAGFASRFGFTVCPETAELCSHIDITALSKERIEDELKKALLKADKPSVFFEYLRSFGQLSYWFPELEALIGVDQNPRFHSEGDVWVHTMMVLDEAAKCRDSVENPYFFMMSALCHDYGKKSATVVIDGVIHSYGHEKAGIEPAAEFLTRISNMKALKKYVLNMIENHMRPNKACYAKSSVKDTNHIFDDAVEPLDLIYLGLCDNRGKIGLGGEVNTEPFLTERYKIYLETISKPFVGGEDLIKAGLMPDGNFSDYLAYAHKLRLAGINKESALVQTLAYARKNCRKKS